MNFPGIFHLGAGFRREANLGTSPGGILGGLTDTVGKGVSGERRRGR
jgi:hypothetical protein